MAKKILRYVGPVIGILLFTAALWVLHYELRHYHYHEIMQDLGRIPVSALACALLLSTLNYFTLALYEILGFKYIQHPLPWYKIAFSSFIAYAFSNNVGFYAVSGSAVRFRLYSAMGLSTFEITRIVAFCSILTFWLGLCTICSVAFLFEPVSVPKFLHLPFASVRGLGVLFSAVLLGSLAVAFRRKKPLLINNWEFEIPRPTLTMMLVLAAALDWILFAGVLYVVLPPHPGITFPLFLGIFLLAQLAGLISHIPGGLGVFESVLILLLPGIPASSLIGSLLVFRAVYYLIPLVIAAVSLGMYELYRRKSSIAPAAHIMGQWTTGIVPHVLAVMTFIGGVMLLFSGATPAEVLRLKWLIQFMPLPVLEMSHFLGSLAGMALLILAWGLYRRFDAAYHFSLYMMAGGIVMSLLKGADYEESIILTIMVFALLPCKRHFFRRTSFVNEPFTPGWVAAILVTLAMTLWLGFFSYKHIAYSHELWWQFSFEGNASRFLRANVGIGAAIFAFAMLRLFAPARPRLDEKPDDVEAVRSMIAASPQTSACLALLGDKSFLLSKNQDAFIMFAVSGRSWIAMSDPAGNPESIHSLVWDYRELCDRHGGWTVFYEVGREHLHQYLDIGLTLLKMGEEARVDLAEFALEGGKHKSLRHTVRKFEQDGYQFEVMQPDPTGVRLDELRAVSDAWLADKKTREKRFSLGWFDPKYLSLCPLAVVKKENAIVAFSNLWITERKEEISIDLMRYGDQAPKGTMDYLFANLMRWAKQNGYRWFNLGMAPFSGLESRSLAPMWHRMGSFLFAHGEDFYNFQGLRSYKEKFDPVWEPRYLALPGGMHLPFILKDLSSLVSGGIKGVIAK
jgi:phosphatidylglycerol lysyltransferase